MDEVNPTPPIIAIKSESIHFKRGSVIAQSCFKFIYFMYKLYEYVIYIYFRHNVQFVTVQNESIVQHIPYMSNKHAHNRKTLLIYDQVIKKANSSPKYILNNSACVF